MLVRDWHRRPLLARSNHMKTAILVRVKVSGICGSDVHRYLGTEYGRGYYNYPMNSGHQYCGDVVQVGNRVQEFRAGEKVTLGVSWVSGKLGAFSD
jgi:D-arabinose 1-dehydrogenase-like Zn-dependent alcohol dehydrogenase